MSQLIVIALLLIIGLWGLGDTRLPLGIAFFLAYLFFPLVQRVEKLKIRRDVAILTVFTLSSAVNVILLAVFFPHFWEESKSFFGQLPEMIASLVDRIQGPLDLVNQTFGTTVQVDQVKKIFVQYSDEISQELWKFVTTHFQGALANGSNFVQAMLNLALIPIFFFYIIDSYEKISAQFLSIVPRFLLPQIEDFKNRAEEILNSYVRGQMLVALILTGLYALGLWIVQVKFGLLIGLIAGAISIIPYAGLVVGFSMALLMSLIYYQGMGTVLGVVIVFGVVQGLEGFLITPKLVGKSVGLGSFATILALIIGTNLLGVVGIFLAIPIAAIIKVFYEQIFRQYQSSALYQKKSS